MCIVFPAMLSFLAQAHAKMCALHWELYTSIVNNVDEMFKKLECIMQRLCSFNLFVECVHILGNIKLSDCLLNANTFFLSLLSVFGGLLSAAMCIMFMDRQRREAAFLLLLLLSWAKSNHAVCYSWMSFCDFL